jgi:hypothetical protein
MSKTVYTLHCQRTGESQAVIVCDQHAREMPMADGDLVTASLADEDVACDFCWRRRTTPARTASVEILIGHEPGDRGCAGGWHALAPGADSGLEWTPWRAIASAIWAWHTAGRPPSAGIYFAGAPHPTAVGTVAEEARNAWAASATRSAA